MSDSSITEIENTSCKVSILCNSLRGLTSFLSSKTQQSNYDLQENYKLLNETITGNENRLFLEISHSF